jgi:primosomal protein N' (replication factor Y)
VKVDVAIPGTKFDVLTYDTQEKLTAGDLVLVPLRNSSVYGIVVTPDSKRKITRIKTVHERVYERFISPQLLTLYTWIADYYVSSLGEVLRCALPKKILKKYTARVQKEPPLSTGDAPAPTYAQSQAIQRITSALKKKRFAAFLLHGITGSGKTEVYLRCAEYVLNDNGRALVLVPEISMTPLLFERFRKRFGSRVITIHSSMTDKERRDTWHAIMRGEYSIVIGPRSSIFVPVPELRIIIIDEEHDQSYKEHERTPRYNARDVAVMRAHTDNIPVVLGSATPQIESYYNASTGKYTLLPLNQRIDNKPLPAIETIDLKQENTKYISKKLKDEIEMSIKNGEQIILFLNRRGFAPHLMCPSCGFIAKCPFCSLPVVHHKAEHKKRARLSCHICAYSTPVITVCPQCARSTLLYRGAGTQRIEDIVTRILAKLQDADTDTSAAQITRLDRDSVRKKGQAQSILQKFEQREARILLGTQLVTKGFDFPDVTLVGIVNADIILNLPDFRSSERTFQMLTQVAGRTGRGEKRGKVLMQTYHPDQYSELFNQLQDYPTFYDHEISLREQFAFPPFSRLILLRFRGKQEEAIWKEAKKVLQQLKKISGVTTYGPNRSFYYRIRHNYRVFILLKVAKKFNNKKLHMLRHLKPKGCVLDIDVDPLEVF